LLKVAISRQLFGVQEYGVTEVKFREMLGHYGVHYIVIEPDFWADLKSMQMLVGLLHQRQFKLMTKIPIMSNREHIHSELEIYENMGPLSGGKNLLRVELPVSGIAVEGAVGQNR
jgi:predicted phosphatase